MREIQMQILNQEVYYPLGWVVGHLLLAILYFAVVTPIGLALRLAGRDPMNRRFDDQSSTYWRSHRPPDDDTSYYRQY